MCSVFVIGTFHVEDGACTSEELYKIIEKISPEVIFCEATPEDLPEMLKATENFNTPEIKVIRKIVKEKSIKIKAVDKTEYSFDGRLEAMSSLFIEKIQDYYYATLTQVNQTQLQGFKFLNSKYCDQINRNKSLMEKNFIDGINNQKLSDYYSEWVKWNDIRENHWITMIHNYFENNKPKKAVFLVGSGHRYRLIDKIQRIRERNEVIYNWDFFPIK